MDNKPSKYSGDAEALHQVGQGPGPKTESTFVITGIPQTKMVDDSSLPRGQNYGAGTNKLLSFVEDPDTFEVSSISGGVMERP